LEIQIQIHKESSCSPSNGAGRLLAAGVFIGFFLLFQLGARQNFLQDPGTFFHTRVGQLILEEGQLPRQDRFAFPYQGQRWIAQQWLGEVILAALYKFGGFDTQVFIAIFLLACLYAWLALRIYRAGMTFLLTLLMITLVVAASSHHFLVRPLLASILFQALVSALLLEVERCRAGLACLWFLPIAIAIWANVHGAVLGGVMTIGLTGIGWGFLFLTGRPGPLSSWRGVRTAAIPMAACIPALLATPYGLDMFDAWGEIVNSPLIGQLIVEHRPMLTLPQGWAVLPLAVSFTLLSIGALRERLVVGWAFPLVWLLLAFTKIRHAPIFAVTAAVALPDLFQVSRFRKWLDERWQIETFRIRANVMKGSLNGGFGLTAALAMLLLLIGLVFQGSGVNLPILGTGWVSPPADRWPEAVRPVIFSFSERAPDGTPIFNELFFGGYLAFQAPRLRTFIDDRCELAKDRGLSDYVRGMADPEIISGWQKKYCFKAALTKPGSPFDVWFSKAVGWEMIASSTAGNWFEWRP